MSEESNINNLARKFATKETGHEWPTDNSRLPKQEVKCRLDYLEYISGHFKAGHSSRDEEVKTLITVCKFVYKHLESMENYSLVAGARHELSEALKKIEEN